MEKFLAELHEHIGQTEKKFIREQCNFFWLYQYNMDKNRGFQTLKEGGGVRLF